MVRAEYFEKKKESGTYSAIVCVIRIVTTIITRQFFASSSNKINRRVVAIFWDIENCALKKKYAAKDFLKVLKRKLLPRDVAFCYIITALNPLQISGKLYEELQYLEYKKSAKVITRQGGKNSADNLLMDEMLEFACTYKNHYEKVLCTKIGGRCLNDETEVLLPGSILLYSRKIIK